MTLLIYMEVIKQKYTLGYQTECFWLQQKSHPYKVFCANQLHNDILAPNTNSEISLPQTVGSSSLPSPQSLSLSHFQS